jgi:outer membrane protein
MRSSPGITSKPVISRTRTTKATLFVFGLAGAFLLAGAQSGNAQTSLQIGAVDPDAPVGKRAGSFMIRLRAIGVIPQNFWSEVKPIGGHIETTNTAAPEVNLSYFFTDNIAAELIAATTRHNVSVSDSVLGHVDIGSVWVLPPTLTFQYHFMPHRWFSPYIGAGLNVTFFYASHPNNPPIAEIGYSTAVGPAIQAGFDYNFTGHWFLNFDVKQIFNKTYARANGGTIKANTWLSPTVIGAGIGYRF